VCDSTERWIKCGAALKSAQENMWMIKEREKTIKIDQNSDLIGKKGSKTSVE
jgi:hypothetical protein